MKVIDPSLGKMKDGELLHLIPTSLQEASAVDTGLELSVNGANATD